MIIEGIRVPPRTYEGGTVAVNGRFAVVVTRVGSPPTATVDTEPLCIATNCLAVLEYTHPTWTCRRCGIIASPESIERYCRNYKAWKTAREKCPSVGRGLLNLPPGADPIRAAATLKLAALPTRVVHLPPQSRPGTVILGIRGGPAIRAIYLGLVLVLDPPEEIDATAPTCGPGCPSLLKHDRKNSVWTCSRHGTVPPPSYNIEPYLRPLDWHLAAPSNTGAILPHVCTAIHNSGRWTGRLEMQLPLQL